MMRSLLLFRRLPVFVQCFLCAIVIVALQLAFVLFFASGATLTEKYLSLAHWDSWHYTDILKSGYRVVLPFDARNSGNTNITFFPGYPLVAQALGRAAGTVPVRSLLLTSLLSSVGLWTYFLLLCRRRHIGGMVQGFAVLTILSFPMSFFFVTAYTESLFMLFVLGYIYWCDDEGPISGWIAAFHGFFVSLTRPLGVVFAVYPLFSAFTARGPRGLLGLRLWLTAAALPAAIGAFLLFVHVRFGDWRYPFTALSAVGHEISLTALLDIRRYQLFMPHIADGLVNPDALSLLMFPIIFFLLLFIAGFDAVSSVTGRCKDFMYRLPLYAVALLQWGIYVIFRASNTQSVSRYMLPVFLLLIFLSVDVCERHIKKESLFKVLLILLPIAIVFMLFAQAGLIDFFSRDGWVA